MISKSSMFPGNVCVLVIMITVMLAGNLSGLAGQVGYNMGPPRDDSALDENAIGGVQNDVGQRSGINPTAEYWNAIGYSGAAQIAPADYLRSFNKRRMSKITCLKSCVGQHILHPMQCHSLC